MEVCCHSEDRPVIELDARVTSLQLGIDEYIALRILGIETIRDILLLDVDRVLTLPGYDQSVRNRLAVWQKLLRKYLTYEKLHGARPYETTPQEDLNIHDTVSAGDFSAEEIEFLTSLNLLDFLAFLDADPGSGMYDDEAKARLRSLQERYTVKRPREAPREQPARAIQQRTVTPGQFLDERISETGLMEGELDILKTMHVQTVREFIDLDIAQYVKDLDLDEETFIRLSSWQRYLKKRLHLV